MNKYPLWRYIMLLVLIVLGFIYALPNLPQYGNDYAVQISPKEAVVSADFSAKLREILVAGKVPFLSINPQAQDYLIRFKTSDDQRRAQDILQASLKDQDTIALNLAPKTPRWLQLLGAEPMRLGLDLSGGIHFLMNVDVEDMVKERQSGDLHAMGDLLRTNTIRYSAISNLGSNGILIRFRSLDAQNKALALLSKQYTEYNVIPKQQGIDYLVQCTMQPQALVDLEQYAVQQNLMTLRNRVNELGVSEPVITQQGKNQISVDLPGVQDSAHAKAIIGKIATIRLQLVDTEHDAAAAAATGIVPFGSTLYRYENQPVLLKNAIILHGASITSASTISGDNGQPAVSVRVSGDEVAYFNKMTAENIGKPLAVIYVENVPVKTLVHGVIETSFKTNEQVINIANIQSALGANFQVSGLESADYAKNLALLLRSGAYTAKLDFVQEQVVGPSLGAENIHKGVLSCEVGSLLVFIFMILYYRLFGFIADLALFLNVVFVVAIMSLVGFTLTLPGIAALVLTVGMAVDANVLINERIREELRLGMSPKAAINAGYSRAFTTIVDANVSTLIVALVLFIFGTGPVQGFAITLSIGLLCSMVTSIFFTRAVINLIYGNTRTNKTLSIGIRLKKD